MTTISGEGGRKRILALDGGGVRGVVELAFLERIETMLARRAPDPEAFRLADYFDLIGGTSTGAIIASGLATGRRVRDIVALYEELAPRVFRREWWRLTGLQSRFAARPLAELLNREFGDITLGDPRIRAYLAIVAKRVDTGSPWIVSNIPFQPYWEDPADGAYVGNKRYSLPSLIRASTAAPYYFGPERIRIGAGADSGVFVDGGVTPYNNPSLALLMLATMKAFGLRWPLAADRMLFVSIGAGSFRSAIPAGGMERKPAGKFALDTLVGLIGDNQMAALTMMQWLGASASPWTINSEIGDMRGECLAGEPLFSFSRYDLRLEAPWLRDNLGFAATERQLRAMRRLDDPSCMKLLSDLARAAAERQVEEAHFPAGFTPA